MQYIILLKNAREVIKADNLCKQHNIKIKVIATPTHLSSECGMALAIDTDNIQEIANLLSNSGLHQEIHEQH